MGIKFEYSCQKCSYTAEVSGGRDVGMVATTRTMTCDKCKTVSDVCIGRFGKEGPSGDPAYDKRLNRCPECHSRSIQPWPRQHPCPKCGTRMTKKRNSFIMWD